MGLDAGRGGGEASTHQFCFEDFFPGDFTVVKGHDLHRNKIGEDSSAVLSLTSCNAFFHHMRFIKPPKHLNLGTRRHDSMGGTSELSAEPCDSQTWQRRHASGIAPAEQAPLPRELAGELQRVAELAVRRVEQKRLATGDSVIRQKMTAMTARLVCKSLRNDSQ
jgi:hypothetical protein